MNSKIRCVLMRGGTSRGPFFLKEWLPESISQRDQVLLAAMGSPHELQIDGLGGGHPLTSKVAIVSPSEHDQCDVDYLFAQVSVDEARVDTRPNCGNMLAGVGPFAIEQGLVQAVPGDGMTLVRVFNVNTRSRVDVRVHTCDGTVVYDGTARIDGVPGSASPILLDFLDAWGQVTGSLFPTGQRIDVIDGVEVTCIDAAQVMMIVRASDLGLVGDETPSTLDSDAGLLARLEKLRLTAGQRMGLGDVSKSVLPKPVIISRGSQSRHIVSRYFTPWRCHRSHAATGAIGVAVALALPGTVANHTPSEFSAGTHHIVVHHPAGGIDVEVTLTGVEKDLNVQRASLVRTARKIMEGTLYLPDGVMTS